MSHLPPNAHRHLEGSTCDLAQEQPNRCKLTECQGQPRCSTCKAMDARYAVQAPVRLAAVDGTCAEPESTAEKMRALHERAAALLVLAERWGLVLTVEQVPLQPLAMGHYATSVSVRPARVKACA